jgi:SAM-dependent methyltransferase
MMEKKTTDIQKSGFHSEFGLLFGRAASWASLTVRQRMYRVFTDSFGHPESILDVGVTSESVAPEANFFEEMFPFKERITAVGVEDAFHLEQKYPGLRFVKVAHGQPLPFQNHQFKMVFSNAVLEHIVEDQEQIQFLQELLRVGEQVFLTTPHKYFPIEHHTGMPFVHFLWPELFYFLLRRKGNKGFYNRHNLRPLGPSDLKKMVKVLNCSFRLIPVRFCGFISNWILILDSSN